MSKQYQLKVDRNKCIGAASCVAIAPNTFSLDEEEIAVVATNPQELASDQLLAAQSCPVGAIQVIDKKTQEQIWPPLD